jgi:hypothetical protein
MEGVSMTTPTKQERYLRAWLKDAGVEAVLDALIAQIPAEAHAPVSWETPPDLKRWRAAYKALDRARTAIHCYTPPKKDIKADIADYLREYPEDVGDAKNLDFYEESVMGTSVQSSDVLRRFQYWRDRGRRPRQVQEAMNASMETDGADGYHFLEWLFGVTGMLPPQLRHADIPRIIDGRIDEAMKYGPRSHVLVQDFALWLIRQRPDLEPAIRQHQRKEREIVKS